MTTEDYQLCVRLLKNKIFLGHYSGRHRVDEIDDFRDVINLHYTEEELQRDIDILLTVLNKSRASVYVAFSDPSRNGAYSLWVQLDGIAFGHYWFQIKHVRLTTTELFCVVSVLRSVPTQLVNPTFSFSQGFESAMQVLRGATSRRNVEAKSKVSTAEKNESDPAEQHTDPYRREGNQQSRSPQNNTHTTHNTEQNRNAPASNPINNISQFSILKDFRGMTFNQIKERFSNDETAASLIKTILLCCFFTIIGAMNLLYECLLLFINLVAVTGDFTIKVIHAISRLIESAAPIFLGVLNFVGKLVTGLYILVAMMCGCTPYMPQQQRWRGSPPKRQALMYR